MEMLFRYNWQVRQEWLDWCKELPTVELERERTGGVGSILKTLNHIVDVEYSWICDLQGKPDQSELFQSADSLEQIAALSEHFRPEISEYVSAWKPEMEQQILQAVREDGSSEQYTYGEVMRHVIAHEIHHMGQMSVWSRELDKKPVSANLIRRGLA
ncbi:DinB family protein [Paenibacillus bovis]|uniref:Damage-inducible protein DinB n=1 Tax=Paenibacillus bovis TaxID=1616788 RepID=A0A172ZGA8_9BACL|nr:DinB family protein [Paenibacillus bovis]ANF96422.1 damage-inducible protein DinB [Paenibacillus bovis]